MCIRDSDDVERTGADLVLRRNTTTAWLPGIGFQRNLDAEWSVFGGIHRGFLPPGSSADVEPEWAWSNELGMRWIRPRAEGTFTGFGHFGRNLQGSDFASSGGAGDGDVFNAGGTRVMGLEAALNVTNGTLPEDGHRWELGLTYTWTDARFTTDFDSGFEPWGTVMRGYFLPYLTRHQGAVRMSWARAGWSVDATARFVEGMRTAAGDQPLEEAFTVGGGTVVDAAVRYGLGNGFALELTGRNLADAIYVASARPAGLRPGMPRTLSVGFNLSF